MRQAAIANDTVRASSARSAHTTAAEPASFGTPQNAWRRNLEAGAEAVRAFQQENAQFANRLIDLNLQAARAIGGTQAAGDRFMKSFELGASALELYLGYLGRSAALAQQAIVLPWTDKSRS